MTPSDNYSFTISPHNLALLHSTILPSIPLTLPCRGKFSKERHSTRTPCNHQNRSENCNRPTTTDNIASTEELIDVGHTYSSPNVHHVYFKPKKVITQASNVSGSDDYDYVTLPESRVSAMISMLNEETLSSTTDPGLNHPVPPRRKEPG